MLELGELIEVVLAVRFDLALALLQLAVAPGERLVDLDLELALEVTQLLGREWILEREGAEGRGGVLEDLARGCGCRPRAPPRESHRRALRAVVSSGVTEGKATLDPPSRSPAFR